MALRPTETLTSQNPAPPLTRAAPGIPGVTGGVMAAAQDSSRRLIVGREIELSGEISACETLVVEGRVEASLSDSQRLEIAESGSFKGDVEIDEAIVAGRFEGDLTARQRLVIRSTGRVDGNVRYGDIEINAGGRIVGHVEALEAATAPMSDAASGKDAAPSDDLANDDAPQPKLIVDDDT